MSLTGTSIRSQEEVEDEVMSTLPQLNAGELEEACGSANLVVKDEMKGKKRVLYKFIMQSLCEESDDDNFGMVLLLSNYLKNRNSSRSEDPDPANSSTVNTNITPKVEPVETVRQSPLQNSDSNRNSNNSNTRIDSRSNSTHVVKWSNWKISGTIGGNSENKMTYTSLKYQVDSVKKLDYPEAVICSAIIKAICPTNPVRGLLENSPDFDLDTVLEILHSHCSEKDSAAYFSEMQNTVQDPVEDLLQFVTKLLVLKKKVLNLSTEEGLAYDASMVGKRFFHALYTGIRSDSCRTELREKCKDDHSISDSKLMKHASDVTAHEKERKGKLSVQKSGLKSSVNAVGASSKKDEEEESKPKAEKLNPFAKIEELKTSHNKEMLLMRQEVKKNHAELQEIKNAILGNNGNQNQNNGGGNSRGGAGGNRGGGNTRGGGNSRGGNNRGRGGSSFTRFGRRWCQACYAAGVPRCVHCYNCGSDEHKFGDGLCSENE